jgi:two-component system cell cycle sensor histidine kinase/response regulator CckA
MVFKNETKSVPKGEDMVTNVNPANSNYRIWPLTSKLSYMLPALLIILNIIGWLWLYQDKNQIEGIAITTFQHTQLEIVHAVARSVSSHVAHEVVRKEQPDISEIEQEVFKRFVEPILLLDNGDAWIYAPDHVVFDLSSDFPDIYRGKSMAEIFALQAEKGASHYEEMTEAVMSAREGVGWYIWLPEKGKEIAAWTPVRVAGRTWTIGLSTPLPEILAATGASQHTRTYFGLMGVASVLTVFLVFSWFMAHLIGRKQEEALRESEEKYRLFVENANDAVFVAQDDVIKYANPSTLRITGYSGEELTQIPFVNLIHPEDRDMVFGRYIRGLKSERVTSNYSFRSINKTGEELWLQINSVLISWEGKPAILNFVRDTSAEKRLEAQLMDIRKMEALGTLAGGIAHDFNNLLMGIQGRTSLMLMDTDFSQQHYEDLKGIEDIVKRAAGLNNQLLGFARKGKDQVNPTDLNILVHKTSQMFGRTNKDVRINTKFQEDLWTVEVDRSQIEQVLFSLFFNSHDAMPAGGELYLQTENVTLDESFTEPDQLCTGKYVKISVTDTGVGIDEAIRERIFEPFFTTKRMGRGTGLSLASAYGIIKNHSGMIHVYSKKDEGTTFSIYLPASEKEIIEQKALPEEIFRGTETVLLVDDEDMIIDIGEKILKMMGYEVITARSGREALRLYKENQVKINLVVLDMIMPGMSGGETYDRLKGINPNVKVLLSSGYSMDGQASEILKRGCSGFIQKPFRMRDLSQIIREILDKE